MYETLEYALETVIQFIRDYFWGIVNGVFFVTLATVLFEILFEIADISSYVDKHSIYEAFTSIKNAIDYYDGINLMFCVISGILSVFHFAWEKICENFD